MRRLKKYRISIERLGHLKGVVVITTLAVAGWYVPSTVGGREPALAPAIRAVTADAAASFYDGKATETLPAGTSPGRLVTKVDLQRKALGGWHVSGDARVSESSDEVHLSLENGTVTSNPILLGRGHYEILIDARTQVGGVQVGIASAASDLCAGNAFLSSVDGGERPIPLAFAIRKAAAYYLVFRSWPGTERSVAVIRNISIYNTSELLREHAVAQYYRRSASPLVPVSATYNASTLYSWTFKHGTPGGWHVTSGTYAKTRAPGLFVRTASTKYGYVLTSNLGLTGGAYLLRFNGVITEGGLSIGAVDMKTDRWIAVRYYWYAQRRSQSLLATRLYLPHATRNVELVIANWAPTPSSSRWLVNGIELDQLY